MNTIVIDKKYAKLPKYAQKDILHMQRCIADLQNALRVQKQDTPSNIQWGHMYMPDRATGYLDDDEIITFRMRQRPDSHIRVRLDKEGLKISGDCRLSILCESSNCFTVIERP